MSKLATGVFLAYLCITAAAILELARTADFKRRATSSVTYMDDRSP